MRATDVNEIRARLLAIAGQANSLHVMLCDVSFPQNRIPYIDNCTDKLCRELERLSIVVAQGIEKEQSNAARMCNR